MQVFSGRCKWRGRGRWTFVVSFRDNGYQAQVRSWESEHAEKMAEVASGPILAG